MIMSQYVLNLERPWHLESFFWDSGATSKPVQFLWLNGRLKLTRAVNTLWHSGKRDCDTGHTYVPESERHDLAAFSEGGYRPSEMDSRAGTPS
jgi:hypothetical protein